VGRDKFPLRRRRPVSARHLPTDHQTPYINTSILITTPTPISNSKLVQLLQCRSYATSPSPKLSATSPFPQEQTLSSSLSSPQRTRKQTSHGVPTLWPLCQLLSRLSLERVSLRWLLLMWDNDQSKTSKHSLFFAQFANGCAQMERPQERFQNAVESQQRAGFGSV
jgi:hypothetical protein